MAKNSASKRRYRKIPTDHSFSSSTSGEFFNDDDSVAGVVSGVRDVRRYSSLSTQPYQKNDDEESYEDEFASQHLVSKDDLLDVPLDGRYITNNDVEFPHATIYDDHMSPKKSADRKGKKGKASKILEDRLKVNISQLNVDEKITITDEDISRYENEKERKPKEDKKSNKSKKSKRRKAEGSTKARQNEPEEMRRAAVFKTFFKESFIARGNKKVPTPITTEDHFASNVSNRNAKNSSQGSLEMTQRDTLFSFNDDVPFDEDPNDECPPSQISPVVWNPSALITSPRSNSMNDSENNGDGYIQVKIIEESSNMAEGKKEINVHYRLNKIKEFIRSRKRKETTNANEYEQVVNLSPRAEFSRSDSIVWGDESVTDGEVEEMHLFDECNDGTFNDSNHIYQGTIHFIENSFGKRRHRVCMVVSLAITILLVTSITIFFTSNGDSTKDQSAYYPPTLPSNNVGSGGKDPVQNPDSQPTDPIEAAENNTANEISQIDLIFLLEDFDYITSKITPDKSVFDDSDTPQSKAKEWCINDMAKVNEETSDRIAQRYILATLFFSTNGNGWVNANGWLNGHECLWHGVTCEPGADNVTSVSHLDLSKNDLNGTIPLELGHLSSLAGLYLWGNSNLFGLKPSVFSGLVNMHTLYLDKNQLEDNTIKSIGKLKCHDMLLDLHHIMVCEKVRHEII